MEGIKERIVVIDSPPGSGKTSKIIEYINSLPEDQKVLYITPFLDECERIQKACSKKKFVQPDTRTGKGRKRNHFLSLLDQKANIASTHSLFASMDDEIITALRSRNYILILDEAFQVLTKFDMYKNKKVSQDDKDAITKKDIDSMLKTKIIRVESDYKIRWVSEEIYMDKYSDLKNCADRGLLYLVNDSLLMWSFPCDVFLEGIFDEVYVLTYLFEFQIQKYYYDYFNIKFSQYHIETINGKYEIIKTENNDYEKEWLNKVKSLINILDSPKMNKIGAYYEDKNNRTRKTALSSTWYDNHNPEIQLMRSNIINFFINITHSKSNERMWTCFEKNKAPNKYKGQEYGFRFPNLATNSKIWVALNSRSTNEFGHKSILAYPLNRFTDPFYIKFFEVKGIELNQSGIAISEFIQWIWRSRIRNDKSIQLYVPSERMRILLKSFLDGELSDYLSKKIVIAEDQDDN